MPWDKFFVPGSLSRKPTGIMNTKSEGVEEQMEKYRIDESKGLEFGVFSLGDHLPNPLTGERISAEQRMHEFIEFAKLAEQVGIDFFSIGESHQAYFAAQAHDDIDRFGGIRYSI